MAGKESKLQSMRVLEQFPAASKSYAPYSGNFAGCVIETTEGKMYAGRYAENAAFNPSVSPLQAAFIQMTMATPLFCIYPILSAWITFLRDWSKAPARSPVSTRE